VNYTELAQIRLRSFLSTTINIGLIKDKQNTYLLKDYEVFKDDHYIVPWMRVLNVQLTVAKRIEFTSLHPITLKLILIMSYTLLLGSVYPVLWTCVCSVDNSNLV
jgi:hypothetical protein